MPISREVVESAFSHLWDLNEKGEIERWPELFSEKCSFVNSMLSEPVRGREALRALTNSWPRVENLVEWSAIDESRLVVGWRERSLEPAVGEWYRGISTFVFDSDGLISSYEAFFDTEEVRRAAAS